MHTSWVRWFLLAVGVLGAGSGLAWRWNGIEQLRTELQLVRAENRELARVRREQETLRKEQPATTELETLRADRAALEGLRGELAALRKKVEEAERAPIGKATSAPVEPEARPAGSWKNVGRASPKAALETALWAAVGGDVEALAASLQLEGRARERAEKIFERLPPEARGQHGSPDNLIALLTAKDVPVTGSMRVMAEKQSNENETTLAVVFESETAPKRIVAKSRQLKLQRNGGDWKLVVPEAAVEIYGATLAAPAGTDSAAK